MKTFRIGKMKNKEIGMRELEYIHVKMKVFKTIWTTKKSNCWWGPKVKSSCCSNYKSCRNIHCNQPCYCKNLLCSNHDELLLLLSKKGWVFTSVEYILKKVTLTTPLLDTRGPFSEFTRLLVSFEVFCAIPHTKWSTSSTQIAL